LSLALRPLRSGDVGWLAELHNSAFAAYPVPASLTAAELGAYLEATDVRLDLSCAAFLGDAPVSFCLGALRGGRGSIRGEGTEPGHRRRGLGAQVLERTLADLTAAGAGPVTLEALTVNNAAIRLYERHGFERRRRLLGFSLARPQGRRWRSLLGSRLQPLPSRLAVELAVAWGWDDAPWQLDPESLMHVPAWSLDRRVVVLGHRRRDRFWLYGIATDPAHRGRGLARSALASLGVAWLGVPALVPEEWSDGIAFLRALGADSDAHAQYEMVRPAIL
jgi:ribosomal protein S18 acetylase RimI-like enzyme